MHLVTRELLLALSAGQHCYGGLQGTKLRQEIGHRQAVLIHKQVSWQAPAKSTGGIIFVCVDGSCYFRTVSERTCTITALVLGRSWELPSSECLSGLPARGNMRGHPAGFAGPPRCKFWLTEVTLAMTDCQTTPSADQPQLPLSCSFTKSRRKQRGGKNRRSRWKEPNKFLC